MKRILILHRNLPQTRSLYEDPSIMPNTSIMAAKQISVNADSSVLRSGNQMSLFRSSFGQIILPALIYLSLVMRITFVDYFVPAWFLGGVLHWPEAWRFDKLVALADAKVACGNYAWSRSPNVSSFYHLFEAHFDFICQNAIFDTEVIPVIQYVPVSSKW